MVLEGQPTGGPSEGSTLASTQSHSCGSVPAGAAARRRNGTPRRHRGGRSAGAPPPGNDRRACAAGSPAHTSEGVRPARQTASGRTSGVAWRRPASSRRRSRCPGGPRPREPAGSLRARAALAPGDPDRECLAPDLPVNTEVHGLAADHAVPADLPVTGHPRSDRAGLAERPGRRSRRPRRRAGGAPRPRSRVRRALR